MQGQHDSVDKRRQGWGGVGMEGGGVVVGGRLSNIRVQGKKGPLSPLQAGHGLQVRN